MAIQYVGGNTATKAGSTTGTSTISLTTLTGGLSSTAAIGDIVIAVFATGSAADRTLSITDGTTAYTLIDTELYSNGTTYDSNLRVAYKVLTAADTTVTFGPTGNNADAGAMAVHVWRGVDNTTPLDVAAVPATGTGTGRPNAAAILPTTTGAEIIVVGGAAAATGAVFVASTLSNFRTATSSDTNDAMVGIGSFDWVSGSYDPAAWTGGTTNAADAWTAMTIALRPFIAQIDAEAGSFTYTGQDATLARSYSFNAESGTFTYTGEDATLTKTAAPKEINAEAGTFTYTGQDATLSRSYSFNAEAGTFSYLGQDATLTRTVSFNAEAGTFSYTGQDADLEVARSLNAEAGSFSYLGQDATLNRTYVFDAEDGTFTYLGQDAELLYVQARTIDAEAGTFTYTGQDATLNRTYSFNAEAGTFTYTGQDAELTYSSAAKEINAEAGSFTITGQPATFEAAAAFDAGIFVITGQDATFLRTYSFNAEAAAFGEANPYVEPGYVDPYYSTNLTASFLLGRVFGAQAGSFTYTGQNATLQTGTLFPPESDVRLGVIYGPGGIYVGTYVPATKQPLYIFDD